MPAVQPVRPQLIADATGTKARATGESATGNQEEDVQLTKAIKESKDLNENDDKSLQRALQMSMEGESWLQSIYKELYKWVWKVSHDYSQLS